MRGVQKNRGDDKREISLKRAEELKMRISDFLTAKKEIPTGLKQKEEILSRKKKILEFFNGNEEDWNNFSWQLKNRIQDLDSLCKFINLSEKEKEAVSEVEKKYRWAISPYYLSLMDPDDSRCSVRMQGIPSKYENMAHYDNLDPMGEEYTNPAGAITRRYPDRLIINVTNECAMYCRHCQRRRNIGECDTPSDKKLVQESIDYIRDNEEIRDVLITGGDPFTLPTDYLEWIISELRSVEHVEVIRVGSRTPVTMPQRIDDKLVNMLKKYHPLYVNTHFNSPKEITEESKRACERLSNAGIPLGNQAVLLNGINNNKYVMRLLNQELLKIRVRPYYIFHAKHVKGTSHFNTSVDDGIEIMEYLRGYTSGLAIPTYIINAPGGKGKTPILPQYLISRGKGYIKFRTWEGEIIDYENHETKELDF